MSASGVSDSGFTFWALFVVTFIGSLVMLAMEEAEGAGYPYMEPFEEVIDEDPNTNGYNSAWAARGPNNIIYRVWPGNNYAIRVSYAPSDDRSEPWDVTTVITSAFEGMTSSSIGGIVVLANNTTCVYFRTVGGEDTCNLYVAFRWAWEGAWDIREIYGGGTVFGFLKMALNGTHLLFMSIATGNTLCWKTYELATDTFSSIPSTTPEIWDASWSHAWDYDITVNMSGKFIIASESWSGSSYRYYVRDLDKDHAVVYVDTQHSISEVYCVNLMCRSDDTLVFGFTWYASGQVRYGLMVMYQSVPWGGVTRTYVNWGEAGELEIDVYSLGSCIDDDDFVTFYWANDTGSGDPTYISKMTGEGDATEAEWEGAIIDRVYDYGTDDDSWYVQGWYDGRYPIVGGYSVNLPASGWMGHHIYRNEVGDPDDYEFALYWNATFNDYDWEEGGGGGGYAPDWAGEDGGPWQIGLIYNADLWTMFIVTATFVGLVTAYRKYADQYTGWRYAQRRWKKYRRPIYGGFRKRRPRPRKQFKYRY